LTNKQILYPMAVETSDSRFPGSEHRTDPGYSFRFRHVGRRYLAETRLRGWDLYREPLLNKGSAFTPAERWALGLEAILPGSAKTIEDQARRFYGILKTRTAPIDQYVEMLELQNRNEHLFYRVLRDHLVELLPILYTPTVGLAAQRYSELFRRSRGIWINPGHRGRVLEVLRSAARHEVRLIVATDNESILGIGDQGAGGVVIAVGKLSLYCAAAGLHPALTLPVSLDFGTENRELLESPDYLGWRQRRLRGNEYFALLDEFVAAVKTLFPSALLQWEDLRNETALGVLDRYADALPSFNDDIEGTGAVTAAGVIGAARINGTPLRDHRFVVFGAGAAGLGIARQLRGLLAEEGLAQEEIARRIATLDSRGLIVEGGPTASGYKQELALRSADAEALGLQGGASLVDVVERFQPHALIGTSGVAGAFNEQIVRSMLRAHPHPLVLPLSNPTALAEGRPEDLIRWSNGRVLVATGSPFEPVQHEGRSYVIGQANNVFVFPGLGLGALAAQASRVTPAMLRAAVRALAESVTTEDLANGRIYPSIERLPAVTRSVARAVAQAVAGSLTPDVERAFADLAWVPEYPEVVAVD
jgi:malic enzyme